jgi:hypothetical protein
MASTDAIILDEGRLHLKDGRPYLDNKPLSDDETRRLLRLALRIIAERAGRRTNG